MDTFSSPSHMCKVVDKARASLGAIIPGRAWERAGRASIGRPLGEFVRRGAEGVIAWVGMGGRPRAMRVTDEGELGMM
jgi:hypothetical protein